MENLNLENVSPKIHKLELELSFVFLKNLTGENALAICQCLASVAEYNPQLLSSHMDSLRQLYNTALGMDYENGSIEGRVLVSKEFNILNKG